VPLTNYYRTLGVSAGAGLEEIRTAYRQKARKYHPDVYEGNKSYATRKMKEINAAYNTLKNPEERAAYDRTLAAAKPVRRKKTSAGSTGTAARRRASAGPARPQRGTYRSAPYPEPEVFFRPADMDFSGTMDLFQRMMSDMMDFMEEDTEEMLSSMILAMMR
jgi:curved DNA-binding protein CbpA